STNSFLIRARALAWLMVACVAAIAPLELMNLETSLVQSMAAATARRKRTSLNGGSAQLNASVKRELDGLVEMSTSPRDCRSSANFAGTDSITSNAPSSMRRTRVAASGAHVTMI